MRKPEGYGSIIYGLCAGGVEVGNFENRDHNFICNRLYCSFSSCINGKSAGLGTIAGMADTYWGQNRGRSIEGTLVKVTKILAALFLILAAVLNLKVFA